MTSPFISFGGIASGLDTDAIITQLMAAERVPLDQLEAQRQSYQDKDEIWQSVSTRLSALRSALDALSTRTDFSRFATATSSHESVLAEVVGSAEPSSITFDIDRLAAAETQVSRTTFSSADELTGSGTFRITVDGEDFNTTMTTTTTLTELARDINAMDSGVTASVISVDEGEYKLLMVGTGEEAALDFSVWSSRSRMRRTDQVQDGQTARIEIGNLDITRPTNTFTEVIPGVKIDLLADPAAPVTVSVGRDIDSAVEAIQLLVDELNATLNLLQTETAYDTTSQTGGKLVGDTTARSLITSLQSAISGAVVEDADIAVAGGFGLSITRQGDFTLDAGKLRDALGADFEGVSAFFEDALASRLDEALDYAEGADGSIARTRDRWKAQIEEANLRIAQFEDRLDRKEASLIKEFAAMESLLAGLQSQSAWLSSQLGGGATP